MTKSSQIQIQTKKNSFFSGKSLSKFTWVLMSDQLFTSKESYCMQVAHRYHSQSHILHRTLLKTRAALSEATWTLRNQSFLFCEHCWVVQTWLRSGFTNPAAVLDKLQENTEQSTHRVCPQREIILWGFPHELWTRRVTWTSVLRRDITTSFWVGDRKSLYI